MKAIFLLSLPALLISNNAKALTCMVMSYGTEDVLFTKTVSKQIEIIYREGETEYRSVLQSDGRYTIVIANQGKNAIAAMTIQGQELTLADKAADRILACR